ncbi:MAG: IS66 family insertion sequence element accessory protein TnpB [Verrucomicrobiota bacterium]
MKFDKKTKIFIYGEPIDMRMGFERLSYLVREEMGKDIDVGDLFLFLGKNHRRLKALRFDGSGLVLLAKRMEKKRGFMNVRDLEGRLEINHQELELILHGSVLRKYLPTGQSKFNDTSYGSSPVC